MDASSEMARRLAAARLEFDHQARRFEQAQSRLQATMEARNRNSYQNMLQYSEFARLRAKLGSMPVIEQAKGILMAQQRCGPDEAFDLLRRASQRANVKVRVLAEEILGRVAADKPGNRGELRLPAGRVNGKKHVSAAVTFPSRRARADDDRAAARSDEASLSVEAQV